MPIELVVVEPISLQGRYYNIGDVITDADTQAEAQTKHPNHFRRRMVEETPEEIKPIPQPAPSASASTPLLSSKEI